MVGRLDGTIYSTERKPEHFMRIFGGFGISQNVLDKLKENGCEIIRLKYYGAKIYNYSCPLDLFIYSNKTFTFEGNDLQRFVSVNDMEER